MAPAPTWRDIGIAPAMALSLAFGAGSSRALAGDAPDFQRSVRPILAAKCFACHGPDAESRKAGLRLDNLDGATSVLRSGARAVVPGDPAASVLLARASAEDPSRRMPPDGHDRLTEAEVATLQAWIASGAAYEAPWAFRPMTDPSPPEVEDAAWPRAPLDRFVLATREALGVPAPADIEPMALLRRASFDLRGLPPTEAEVREFEAEPGDAAFERFVDRALADPAFGERWGRHWLDLARYAETLGHEFDYEIPGAWRYRDYIVEAMNEDLAPARLVAEHLAGDMIDPRPGLGLPNVAPIATAWWFLGPATHAPVDVRQDEADRIAGQVDVIGRSFFGLSIACARCHDHKFDPIPATDFFALAGVARNTRRLEAFLDTSPRSATLLRDAQRAARSAGARIADREDAAGPAGAGAAALGAVAGEVDPPAGLSGTVLDVAADQGASWTRSGPAFAEARTDLEPRIALAADGTPRAASAGTVDSAWLDERLVGSARSPAFEIARRYVHVRVRGEAAWMRMIVDNYWLDDQNGLLFEGMRRRLGDDDPAAEPNDPRDFPWRVETFDLVRFPGERAYLELIDDGGGWIEVDAMIASDDAAPPASEAWDALEHAARPSVAPEVLAQSTTREALSSLVAALVAAREALVAAPAPMRALVAEDGGMLDEPLHVRGSSRNYGAAVPRARLSILAGGAGGEVAGSGRLELARTLTDPATPYLWRTLANRVWLKLFGRGVVDTPDDFGQLGAAPWSDELLDHLGSRLARGATLKQIVREIVLSRAYRAAPDTGELPAGAWQAQPVRRIDAESIRDAMLAASGRLDPARGGAGVPVHLTEHMQGRGRPGQSGPVDGAGRRSIYLAVRRNFLDAFLQAFDQPQPATTCGKRHASNVPAQSLAFLNSELVHALAAHWGERIAGDGRTDAERVQSMWRAAYGRGPEAGESAAALAFLADERAQAGGSDIAAFSALAHVLFASKEFIYLR